MAAAVRSSLKDHLRLSLVTIPIRLVCATRADGAVSFHQVSCKTKQRICYQKVAPGIGQVDKDDILRGYEVEPGNYVLLEGGQRDALKLETRHTIELIGRQRSAGRAYAGGAGPPPALVNIVVTLIETRTRPFSFQQSISDAKPGLVCNDKSRGP